MNEQEAWNIFLTTGKVSDYLRYKQVSGASASVTSDTNDKANEDINRGTDNQTTEYR